MNSKFFDLPKEKQDRMINAALKVFALQGYQHAGTDEMIKEAGISKGLLFHYFGSKLGVYSFVYDYCVRYMALELKTTVYPKERNVFEVLKQMEFARSHAMRNYPYIQLFLNRSMEEEDREVLAAVEVPKDAYLDLCFKLESQIDYESLPPTVDPEKLRKTLGFTINGLLKSALEEEKFRSDKLYEEIVSYIDMLKGLVK